MTHVTSAMYALGNHINYVSSAMHALVDRVNYVASAIYALGNSVCEGPTDVNDRFI